MNRFQDISSNRFQTSSQSRPQQNRFRSSSRFKDHFRQTPSPTRIFPESNSSNNSSSGNTRFNRDLNRSSRFQSNLPTNNRWKRDEPASSSSSSNNNNNNNNEPFTKRRNTTHSRLTAKVAVDPSFEPSEINNKFVNLNSMAMDFDQITTKPKQKKNKKNKKKQENMQTTQSSGVKKYSKKYDLTEVQHDDLKNSIINQYNYEVIEHSEEEVEQE
tara:strand:+ start:3093 stop:3737 length:645 start_codon:yes stop_codon:yes gene_type:complete